MGKNLTISISDEVAQKMESFKEINWSEICRAAITSYIEARARPAGFQVQREFAVSSTQSDAAGLKDLQERFVKMLSEGWNLGSRVNIFKVNVDGQPRLFYNLRKLGQRMTSNQTVLEFISVNQDLQIVHLVVSCNRDATGMLAETTGKETPLNSDELAQYNLSRDRMIAVVQGFIKGDIF